MMTTQAWWRPAPALGGMQPGRWWRYDANRSGAGWRLAVSDWALGRGDELFVAYMRWCVTEDTARYYAWLLAPGESVADAVRMDDRAFHREATDTALVLDGFRLLAGLP